MHTRGLGSGREFHRGSVRAEESSASWWPWLPEIEFNPKSRQKKRKSKRNPKLLKTKDDDEALLLVFPERNGK